MRTGDEKVLMLTDGGELVLLSPKENLFMLVPLGASQAEAETALREGLANYNSERRKLKKALAPANGHWTSAAEAIRH